MNRRGFLAAFVAPFIAPARIPGKILTTAQARQRLLDLEPLGADEVFISPIPLTDDHFAGAPRLQDYIRIKSLRVTGSETPIRIRLTNEVRVEDVHIPARRRA